MSQEAAPDQSPTAEAETSRSADTGADTAPPKGLLQQMEELLAAVSADLAWLDADLRSSADPDSPAPSDIGGASS
ncbi:hypothetical protein [Streptantibioticus ferralitis]|uniref:Uncharacterized protein n=1 Tax=Streptantibioticus ferralitis TaxID=236510 RepID=A0ABT5Z4K4_9ACTN|nr:hypothetical protein [Streptantibioticus ferralitis]MDF2258757.1 hypothetical protein [Streptantibioticus ferralitis]